MPNPNYSKLPPGQGGSNKPMGSPAPTAMPERTANWPGVPGKTQAARNAGTPTKGPLGPFHVKAEGI